MNQKGQSILLIVILIAAAVGGYLIYSGKINLNQAKPIPVYRPPDATTMSKSQNDDTAKWKTYTNNGYGFEFKYPQGMSNAQGNNESFTAYFQGSPNYPYSIILSVVKGEKSFDRYLDELYKKRSSSKKGKVLIVGNKPAFQDNISDNQTLQLETLIDGTPKIIVQMVVMTNKEGNIETLQQINNQILSTFKFTQ